MIDEILADTGVSRVGYRFAVFSDDEAERLDDVIYFDREKFGPFDSERFVESYRMELYRRVFPARKLREIGPDEVVENVIHYLSHDILGRIYRERVVPEREHEIGEYREIFDVVEMRVGDYDMSYRKKLVYVERSHDRACVDDC